VHVDLRDIEALAAICMVGYDPDFPRKAQRGDILVAGKNFASGHMHAHFYLSIKAIGISAIVAESMNRRFYREAINNGIFALICPSTAAIQESDKIEVNFRTGIIRVVNSGQQIRGEILSPILLEILELGGLENYLRARCGDPENND